VKRLKQKIYLNNKHQVVAISANGKVDFKLDKFVKERYSKGIDDFITKISFYDYDYEQGEYLGFMPNITPVNSEHNFDLISYEDDGFRINSFVVSTKEFDEELVFEMEVDL